MTVMRQAPSAAGDFRSKILNRQHVLGTFIKLASPHVVEIVGQSGFDFVIIDQEHSPLDRAAIDIACLAARATNLAAIVRVSEVANILSALDSGATGVMVPHCDSPERARQIAAAQDATVTCIVMIEDQAALAHLEEIAAVKGIDAFFIGRGDLTAALGVEGMNAAVRRITDAARAANMPTVALVSGRDDARAMRDLGVAAFVHSNDQNLLKTAAAQALKDYCDPAAW
jgi:staphyloferrin B biosynthesis citrate synthase